MKVPAAVRCPGHGGSQLVWTLALLQEGASAGMFWCEGDEEHGHYVSIPPRSFRPLRQAISGIFANRGRAVTA